MNNPEFQKICRNIKDKIIRVSFPELKNRKILLYVTWFRRGYSGAAFWLGFGPRFIFINKKLKDEKISFSLGIKILKGLIVHELCHFALIEKRTVLKNIVRGILYQISDKLRTEEESEANKLAINRGYAKEVYLMTKKVENVKKEIGYSKILYDRRRN